MAPLLSLTEVTKCSAFRPAIESLGNARCELAGRQLMTEDCDAPPKMRSKDQDAFGVGVSATDVVGHVGVSHTAEYNVASVLDPSSLTPTTYLLDVAFEMVVDIELPPSASRCDSLTSSAPCGMAASWCVVRIGAPNSLPDLS